MIRVLSIEPSGGLRGSERALIDLIEAAATLEIAVCCPPGTPLADELRRRKVRVLPHFIADLHRKSRWRRVLAALGVLWACLRFRPQVIHLNQSGAYRTALPAATLLGLPIVGHVRLFEDTGYLARRRPSGRRLRALIAVSEAVKTKILSFPELGAIPVHQLYDTYARRETPSVPPARIDGRIACIGRVTPDKGQELLLRALAEFSGAPAHAHCWIIGDGEPEYLRRLREIADATMPGRVRWWGFVADVGPLLETCQVLACPSAHEALGRVVLEAWEMGAIPVAFAGSGGAAEIIAAADAGFLYAEQTPGSLAGALAASLAVGPGEAGRLTQKGRDWTAEHCDPARYGASLTRLFADVLGACEA